MGCAASTACRMSLACVDVIILVNIYSALEPGRMGSPIFVSERAKTAVFAREWELIVQNAISEGGDDPIV